MMMMMMMILKMIIIILTNYSITSSISSFPLQIEKTKAEARLESLRKAGINIDVYVAAARSETRTPEDEEEPGSTQASVTPTPIINSAGDAGSSFTNINVNQKVVIT